MSASHDSICKERVPRRLGALRAAFPRGREPSGSRRCARFGGPGLCLSRDSVSSRSSPFGAPGVPLTLRHRGSSHEALTEVKPPSRWSWRALDRTRCPSSRPAGSTPPKRSSALGSNDPSVEALSTDRVNGSASIVRPKRLCAHLAPPTNGQRSDELRCSVKPTLGHDPRASVPARRASRPGRSPFAIRDARAAASPAPRSPKAPRPEAAARSSTTPPHRRWSALAGLPRARSPRHPSSSPRDLPRVGPSRRPRGDRGLPSTEAECPTRR